MSHAVRRVLALGLLTAAVAAAIPATAEPVPAHLRVQPPIPSRHSLADAERIA
jgi:hypothetical protein